MGDRLDRKGKGQSDSLRPFWRYARPIFLSLPQPCRYTVGTRAQEGGTLKLSSSRLIHSWSMGSTPGHGRRKRQLSLIYGRKKQDEKKKHRLKGVECEREGEVSCLLGSYLPICTCMQ